MIRPENIYAMYFKDIFLPSIGTSLSFEYACNFVRFKYHFLISIQQQKVTVIPSKRTDVKKIIFQMN